MNIKREYEISIWEQKGKDEIKLGIIGSDTMSSPGRAQKPIFTRNTNGTKKLEFYLFYEYVDEIEGRILRNPYCALLSNGRKIKLKWKDKWYEFIITNIIEDSDNKKITYTAQDAYITELSRRGFNIELSTDVGENQGTIFQLTKQILKNSEWSLDEENSLVSPQTLEDVLVELEVTSQISVKQKTLLDSNGLLSMEAVNLKIPVGATIYTFYSIINNEDPFFQFYYLEDKNQYQFNENGFIINCPLYLCDNYKYIDEAPEKTKKIQVVNNKGKKLIRAQKSEYNKIVDAYVKYYKSDEKEVVGYTKTEYFTDDYVINLVTNDKDFITDVGWYSILDNSKIEVYSYPDAETALEMLKTNTEINTSSYLQFNISDINTRAFYNSGPNDNKENLGVLFKGKKFVVRLKYGYLKNNNLVSKLKNPPYDKTTKRLKTGFLVDFCAYDFDEDGIPFVTRTFGTTRLQGDGEDVFKKDGDYWTAIIECREDLSEKELEEMNLGIFLKYADSSALSLENTELLNYYFYLEDCQFFELKTKENPDDDDGSYYLPGEVIDSEAKIQYNYYLKDQEFDTSEEIIYLYRGYEQQNFEKIYYDNFPQIKTVEAKESNIFNLIQTLCENFDCWADFVVEHDSLGYTKKDEKGHPIKKVLYRPYIGKENWSGYRRGINLKNIKRTLDSSQITTKTIVKPNSNEFAPDGFCTIAYSSENPSGESFIYDFSHYISKGLISAEKLHERLYGSNGLYKKLRKVNEESQKLIDERMAASSSLLYNEKEKEVYAALVSELSSSIAEAKRDFRLYSGMSYRSFLQQPDAIKERTLELSGVNGTFVKILSQTSQLKKARASLEEVTENYKKDFQTYKKAIEKVNKNTEKKEKLILDFETKYSNYIQEGVWVSEQCIDHNAYFIEAKKVATTSAIPKVSYNIDVVDISSLEEFFNYNVDIGDKTYVIDPEFFGYLNEFETKTPKKQEVVITELVEDLENPENNKTTVQSYTTQFDDLFQRITATSQQLQLNEGAYNRAAGAFSNYGLDTTYTQNSLNNSNFLLQNNTIKWNVDGFVSTNNINKHEFLKIHNGNIYLTNDGGSTWSAAINGKGINANYIYAGQLDAGKINIVSELKVSEEQELQYCLTMDKDGLSMYSFQEAGKIARVRLGKIALDGDNEFEEDLYGLQLYNNQGVQTFKTDSNGDITMTGTIYAKDGYFRGAVVASKGHIGGWIIEQNQLYHQLGNETDAIIATEDLNQTYLVNGYISNDWRLIFGINNNVGNFGVTSTGNLYANGVDIKDGNISFGDLFKITSNGGVDQAITYGLDIKINDENADKEIVIQSEDRVIGIREKKKDANNNIILENNKPAWTWKTIIGDLTGVTLGEGNNAVYLKDLGIEGYGICTDNGFFSGHIIASNGMIGGFTITDSALYSNTENNNSVSAAAKENSNNPELNINNADGIFLNGETGYFHFGSKSSYIKFYTPLKGADGSAPATAEGTEDENLPKDVLEIKVDNFEASAATFNIREGFVINTDGVSIKTNKDNNSLLEESFLSEQGLILKANNTEKARYTLNETKSPLGEFETLVLNGYRFAKVNGRMGCYSG